MVTEATARYRQFADFAAVGDSPTWQHAAKYRAEALEKTVMLVSSPGALSAMAG